MKYIGVLIVLAISLFVLTLSQIVLFHPFEHVKAESAGDLNVTYVRQWGKCGMQDGEFSGSDCTSVLGSSMEGENGTRKVFFETFGHGPVGIAVDHIGNVFVSDPENNRVQKFTNNGTFLSKWGERGEVTGEFFHPTGITVDNAGDVYVVEAKANRVQKFTNNGTFLTKWGERGNGTGEFIWPTGITVDKAGNVYVVDSINGRLQKFTNNGTFLTKWGERGDNNNQFHFDFGFLTNFNGITTDNMGNVYVVDGDNSRIQKFTNNGTFLTKWGELGRENGKFISPTGIATDNASNVYVVDIGSSRGVTDVREQNFTNVQMFTNNGTFLTKWGQYGEGNGQFSIPLGIAINPNGSIYVADYLNSRVQEFEIK
jgi:tripartite motif-containing protein 71